MSSISGEWATGLSPKICLGLDLHAMRVTARHTIPRLFGSIRPHNNVCQGALEKLSGEDWSRMAQFEGI